MTIYRECRDIFEERQKWFKDNPKCDNFSGLRMPKNPNAYRRFEQYMFYKKEVEEWENQDESLKRMMPYFNPHEKEEYEWIRKLKI